ncbi:MAG: hypothetical protein AAF799_33685 [Myxococcota bacterium]
MKRKKNIKPQLTATRGPATGLAEIGEEELAGISAGSGSHHVQWYEWSVWRFNGGPQVPGQGPAAPHNPNTQS